MTLSNARSMITRIWMVSSRSVLELATRRHWRESDLAVWPMVISPQSFDRFFCSQPTLNRQRVPAAMFGIVLAGRDSAHSTVKGYNTPHDGRTNQPDFHPGTCPSSYPSTILPRFSELHRQFGGRPLSPQ